MFSILGFVVGNWPCGPLLRNHANFFPYLFCYMLRVYIATAISGTFGLPIIAGSNLRNGPCICHKLLRNVNDLVSCRLNVTVFRICLISTLAVVLWGSFLFLVQNPNGPFTK